VMGAWHRGLVAWALTYDLYPELQVINVLLIALSEFLRDDSFMS